MKILICGAGAIGSNLVGVLAPDLKGEHEIIVLDKDVVEERNIQAGTQLYMPDQIGLSKVEALQFNIYKMFQREIEIIDEEVEKTHPTGWNINPREARLHSPDLIIDCFDNHKARLALQDYIGGESGAPNLLHVGFSANFTFAIEWAHNYTVPTDIQGLDICEMPGAAAFVKSVASLGALVVEEFINNNIQMDIVGGKFSYNVIR